MNTAELLTLNVNDHVEKKNGLSYLSWAWAWAEALKADPAAQFHVESWTDDRGNTRCWMDVNGTAMVWVRVTLFGKPMTCMLPVMNSRNEPISIEGRTYKDKYGNDRVEKLDAFNVNTAIMRCMTKALALHGLGLYIYAGEDLPEEVKPEPKTDTKSQTKEEKKEEKKDDPKHIDPRLSAELLVEGMVEFGKTMTNEKGLMSFWKANQAKLDDLKSNYPDLFERVRTVFSDMKAKFKEQANG